MEPEKPKKPELPKIPVPFICFAHPGDLFLPDETVEVAIRAQSGVEECDVELRIHNESSDSKPKKKVFKKLPIIANALKVAGDFTIRARYVDSDGDARSDYSLPLNAEVTIDSSEESDQLCRQNRNLWHRAMTAIETTEVGVNFLHDPWILPFGAEEAGPDRKWQPTFVYEGSTSIYNYEKEYYSDPFSYLIDSLEMLKTKGFKFITWESLIANGAPEGPFVIVQFDVDPGKNSIVRVGKELKERGIIASIQTHVHSESYYPFSLDDDYVAFLNEQIAAGWEVGYHNNSLSTVLGEGESEVTADSLEQASSRMVEEMVELRKSVPVTTYTNHGGNAPNIKVPVSSEFDLKCLDRPVSPELWAPIVSQFTDGGFIAKPKSLRKFVETAPDGGIFIRLHPVKYGNYESYIDLPKLNESKAELLSEKDSASIERKHSQRTKAWIEGRRGRYAESCLGYGTCKKPISAKFETPWSKESKMEEFLETRKGTSFGRQYPFLGGDPRVFWWKFSDSHATGERILNVGAMQPDRKDETFAFLPSGSEVMEVDIDEVREPAIVGDFCSEEFVSGHLESFDSVLLFGLPYFTDPPAAFRAAFRVLKPGGRFLVGFSSDSHPARGGMFLPETRTAWRKGAPVTDEILTYHGNLWSFSEASLADLEEDWGGEPATWEFASHYWFGCLQK